MTFYKFVGCSNLHAVDAMFLVEISLMVTKVWFFHTYRHTDQVRWSHVSATPSRRYHRLF